jgi:hypothetical protein
MVRVRWSVSKLVLCMTLIMDSCILLILNSSQLAGGLCFGEKEC